MGDITQFCGILPPAGVNLPGSALLSNGKTPAGLILRALNPLSHELDAALARNDRPAALRMAYDALAQVAETLAEFRGDQVWSGQTRIHALMIELEPLPYELSADGTLVESGTAVQVSYRNWAVAHSEAEAWSRALAEKFHALWPGAWVIVPPSSVQPNERAGAGARHET